MNIHLYTNVIKKSIFLLIIPNTKSRYSNNTHVIHMTMRAVPEHLRDASCGGAVQIDYIYLLYHHHNHHQERRRLHCFTPILSMLCVKRQF